VYHPGDHFRGTRDELRSARDQPRSLKRFFVPGIPTGI
jgi:hypothetical protein